MLLTVLDGNGTAQKVIVQGQEAITDSSGSIAVTGTAQQAAASNATRSGFFFQNLGVNNMGFSDTGTAAFVPASTTKVLSGTILVAPGGVLEGGTGSANYPVSVNAYSVIGTASDNFTLRQW